MKDSLLSSNKNGASNLAKPGPSGMCVCLAFHWLQTTVASIEGVLLHLKVSHKLAQLQLDTHLEAAGCWLSARNSRRQSGYLAPDHLHHRVSPAHLDYLGCYLGFQDCLDHPASEKQLLPQLAGVDGSPHWT